MAKKFGVLFFILMFMSLCIFPAFGAGKLSFGIDVIRAEQKLIKTSYNGEDILFTAEDFASTPVSDEVFHITVSSLPTPEAGVLKFGELDVFPGQQISSRVISSLRFIPNDSRSEECTFSYRIDEQAQDSVCMLCFCNGENEAPKAREMKLYTAKNISVFAKLSSSDDSEKLSYEIVKQPKNGLLKFEDASSGYVKYTPSDRYTGSDSFCYRVIDRYGVASNVATVTVKIEKLKNSVVYSDMSGHPAAYAAAKLAKEEIFIGERLAEGAVFCPEKEVSRLEFLVMAMKAANYSPNVFVKSRTSFEDDALIPTVQKGYVITAELMGIVDSGERKCFDPNEPITYGDAAVILSRLLELKCDSVSGILFSDKNETQQALLALETVGIISDSQTSSDFVLKRAQAALMLECVLRI